MSPLATPVLDHIVILVPLPFLSNLPSWLTDSLTVLPGGTHADGLTENKLVVFGDGVYLELIAFVPGADPEKRRSHRWARKAEGQIVDFACTLLQQEEEEDSAGSPEAQFDAVRDRVRAAKTGYDYTDPAPGGRRTPDGTELKWAIAAPYVEFHSGDERPYIVGELPFWCLDRTPRLLRVPRGDSDNLAHPCGALGVASVSVSVPADEVPGLRGTYDAIAAGPGQQVAVEGGDPAYTWKLEVPFPGATTHSELLLRTASEGSASEGVHLSISLFTKAKSGQLEGDIGNGRRLVIDLIPVA
ncbi:hypothetical protein NKR19_g2153 [Coniochaeta hoffmannii]|uniref:Glyoxalase-like domain-containing protein n=1 Tax=Coniochaeta hoffmannii TaxID=91930 RepID=A0AA38SB61_9PEZI|nr:hypothetical protein NKR19_g2153 [Coniochaeta hoffmannii]